MCAEMLVHTQAPHFLQPGQLMDQVPMDVSISRGQGEDASRQQSTFSQSVLGTQASPAAGQQQAADQLQANSAGASTAEYSLSRPFSGMLRSDLGHHIPICLLQRLLKPPLCTFCDAKALVFIH